MYSRASAHVGLVPRVCVCVCVCVMGLGVAKSMM
jgi:hypothetical protein